MLIWPFLIYCKVLLLFSIFLEFCFIFRFWFAGYLPNLSWLSAGRLTRKLYAEVSSCLTLDRVCSASVSSKGISPQLGVLIITIFSRPVRMNGSLAGLFVKASVLFVLYLLCQQTWSPAFDKNKNKMWVLICLVILLFSDGKPVVSSITWMIVSKWSKVLIRISWSRKQHSVVQVVVMNVRNVEFLRS